MKSPIAALIFILVLCGLALFPLFSTPYFIAVHDQVQPERVSEMAGALQDGQLPPRFVENLGYGYGYPLFNFYAPLPYYVGAFFYNLGTDIILSTKLMVAIGFVGAGISMFFAGSYLWGKRGGLIAAVVYTLAPYHAVQTYVRGSIGELYAYALLPLILIGLLELYKKQWRKRTVFIGIVAVALLSIAHTVSLYMLLYLSVLHIVISTIALAVNKKDVVSHLQKQILFLVIPLAYACYFWLAAFLEIGLTQLSLETGNDVNYTNHFVALSQLWSSPWGFGGSAPGTQLDGMSFMIGKIGIILTLVTTLTLFIHKHAKNHQDKHKILGLGVLLLISLFHMLQESQFIWQLVPQFALIQFPWRFLTITNLAVACLAGGSVIVLRMLPVKYNRDAVFALFPIIIVFLLLFPFNLRDFPQTKYFKAQNQYLKTASEITAKDHLRFDASKISDEFLPKDAVRPTDITQVSQDQISCDAPCELKDTVFLSHIYKFTVQVSEKTTLYLDKVYFPDYTVTIDGQNQFIKKESPNTMSITLEKGEHAVQFTLRDTPIRSLANIITICAIISTIGYYLMIKRNKIQER